jgi:hypothetical protein
MSLDAMLLVAALVCFLLAAFKVNGPVDLTPLGLACYIATLLL